LIINRHIEFGLESLIEMLKNTDARIQLSSIDCLSQMVQEREEKRVREEES
jgi:hypothetical protein